MGLQQTIGADLKKALKNRDQSRLGTLRVLIGEFQRQPEKELTDQQVVGIIRALVKSEKELLAASGREDSGYIALLEGYLPTQAGEAEIRAWIAAHVDFGRFNNRLQAMKPIMAHFGTNADGTMVRNILQSLDD